MSATYDPALSTDKDTARAMLGDTTIATALLTDEHINAVISMTGSLAAGVAWLARELVILFAQKPTRITAGDVTVDYADRIPQWQALADRGGTNSATTGLSFVTATYGTACMVDEYGRPYQPWITEY